MRKLIAATNITLDGFCDHTSLTADEEIHKHYTDLLRSGDVILYGRITYQLMEYWRTVVENPSGKKSDDEFAVAIDNISKIVFSNSLKNVEWKTATLAKRGLKEEVLELKKQSGKDIFVGSRSLIVNCLNLNLIDEFQLCVHPVIAGKGSPLLENVNDRVNLKLLRTKTFGCGAVTFYYKPIRG